MRRTFKHAFARFALSEQDGRVRSSTALAAFSDDPCGRPKTITFMEDANERICMPMLVALASHNWRHTHTFVGNLVGN